MNDDKEDWFGAYEPPEDYEESYEEDYDKTEVEHFIDLFFEESWRLI